MTKLIFEEEQRFNQWWIWVLMAIALGVPVYLNLTDPNSSINKLLIDTSVMGLIILLLLLVKLKSRIDENGVHISFLPFIWNATYSWDDIYSIETKKYSPIGDYGGWGYRVSFSGKGKAFNIKGNKGIYLISTDGKKRMIGTQKMEEAQKVLDQYQKKSSNA